MAMKKANIEALERLKQVVKRAEGLNLHNWSDCAAGQILRDPWFLQQGLFNTDARFMRGNRQLYYPGIKTKGKRTLTGIPALAYFFGLPEEVAASLFLHSVLDSRQELVKKIDDIIKKAKRG